MITPQAQAWFDWLQVVMGIGLTLLLFAFVVMLFGVGWYFRFNAGDDLVKENRALRQRLEAAVAVIVDETNEDMPGRPWLVEHVLDILRGDAALAAGEEP